MHEPGSGELVQRQLWGWIGWEVWGPRHRPPGKPSLHVRLQGKKPGRCGGSMRVRGGGVSRAPDRCISRAAAEGRWGKRGARQGWAGGDSSGQGVAVWTPPFSLRCGAEAHPTCRPLCKLLSWQGGRRAGSGPAPLDLSSTRAWVGGGFCVPFGD